MEFWTKVSCSARGCEATCEYWATPHIKVETEHDSYGGSTSTSVIEVSGPDDWRTEHLMWGKRFTCPECVRQGV